MASYKKRSGNWQAIIRRKGFPPITRTFDTKKDAETWAAKIESDMALGKFIAPEEREADRTTLSEALDRYEREISAKKKSHEKEKVYIRQWKRSPLAKRFFSEIRGMDVANYRDTRLKTVGSSHVRHELALLSHLFTVAIKEWGMGSLVNPVQQIRKPVPNQGRDRRLHSDEEAVLLAECDKYNKELSSIVRFALETAMRRSEIAGMTWDRVDLKKRTVSLLDTKNGEKRIVPLSPEALRILSDLPRRLDGKVWATNANYLTLSFLRVVSRARKAYEKECEEKGIKPDPAFLVDLTFHDLRHEATSRFFEKGLNPMQVAAITGHKTLQMLKRYTHLKAEDLAELLARG